MFEVYNKETLEKVKVYSVGEDSCGYPKFLIRKDNQWVWRSAKHYITEEEKYKYMFRVEPMSFDEAVRRISNNLGLSS